MILPLPQALNRALADPARGLRALERLDCEESLLGFIRHAWALLEPGRRFVPGWHLEVLCDHLEAVTCGEITRLLINVPPGAMKSLTVAVLWPAWEWGPAGRPELRTIAASYAERLSLRDNMKCRRLVASDWYRGHWGKSVQLVGDQNAKGKFENDRTGFRLATSVGGLGTGERGDRFVIDDPHNVQQAESVAVREATLRWFSETVPTRLNDRDSAIVVVMQRVHERDVSGLILSKDLGYEHLMLPMRHEPERRCVTRLGPADRRRQAGELLWPERFPAPAVTALESALGSYAAAGQLQQRPAPRDGGLFRCHWFEVVEALPAGCRCLRGWDLAASRARVGSDPDWTVGLKLARSPEGVFYIVDVVRLRGSGLEVERAIRTCAQQDGAATAISLPRDPGQAGKVQADYLLRQLAGFAVSATAESGDKTTRAAPVAAQAEAGNIRLLRGVWNEAFLEEVALFPNGAHDDQVDALSRAFAGLVEGGRAPQVFA
ncbi:phage terminase large subunit [Aquibaculum arenosum]|uniref:Phage terminase large subunit n=1 Tax=Aquibaculum arenosum TaxID=3032591 RepID=A0ABT5YQY3_9PROT|nr:phage terminase large subunit [Fodinicurvata sp. CAU 1616]MDF2097304.1 phage terminase large subunit [Fodinicurvata sp. CAU 1616]